MSRPVKCLYCSQSFDREKVPFVKIKTRYAHQECYNNELKRKEESKTDRDKLYDYIKEVYGDKANWPLITRQCKRFIEELNFTYSGIQKTLIYFYEVRHNSVESSNGGIGIVEYQYNESYKYYYNIWEANQKNENKDLSKFAGGPPQTVVKIQAPEREIRKRKLFGFLDEEE